MGIYLALPSTRRRSAWPSIPVTMLLVVLGIITQIGATLYQWSIGVIGLAVGNSLNMGTMLGASVILGLVVLKERVTWRCIAAIMLVSAAVFLFSRAVDQQATNAIATETFGPLVENSADLVHSASTRSTVNATGLARKSLGVVAVCLSGTAFAILTVGVRRCASQRTAPEAIVFIVPATSIFVFGPWTMSRWGQDTFDVNASDVGLMLGVGTFNLLGFLLVTKSLRETNVCK